MTLWGPPPPNLACFSVLSAMARARPRAAFTSLTSATCASVPLPAAARLARKRRARAGVSLSSAFCVWGSRWSSTKARTLQSCGEGGREPWGWGSRPPHPHLPPKWVWKEGGGERGGVAL